MATSAIFLYLLACMRECMRVCCLRLIIRPLEYICLQIFHLNSSDGRAHQITMAVVIKDALSLCEKNISIFITSYVYARDI